MYNLSLIIWLPIIGGLILLLLKPKFNNKIPCALLSLVSLILSLVIFTNFDYTTWQMQYTEYYSWLPNIGVAYELGVDGFSLPLIILTSFMSLLVILAANKSNLYNAMFLIMQGCMCGVFLAINAILFYIFFEAMLIPMFLIIGIWGGENRIYATIKFFLYTFLGSIFLLIACIYLYTVALKVGYTGSKAFSILIFQDLPLNMFEQKWLFWCLLVAFAVKVPMWPVHTWLPDAHVEAPTGGSVILAAITLKIGGYGFLRFLLPIVPAACEYFAIAIIVLSLIAILYIGLVAIVQSDMKKLVAYSSISHMGMVTLGVFIIFEVINNTKNLDGAIMGVEGAILQMLSHGFVAGALFFCIGVLYDRMQTKKIDSYGGVANTMPVFAALLMLFAMANAGLPGTSGFVGEFLIILTVFKAKFYYALLAALTLILGAAYTLWMYKRVIFGKVESKQVAALKDITYQEKLVLSTLAAAILVVGLWPAPVLKLVHSSSSHLLQHIVNKKEFYIGY